MVLDYSCLLKEVLGNGLGDGSGSGGVGGLMMRGGEGRGGWGD